MTTKRPLDQDAVLNFYSPKKPEVAEIDDVAVPLENWNWQNKQGKINYRMNGKHIVLNIKFKK